MDFFKKFWRKIFGGVNRINREVQKFQGIVDSLEKGLNEIRESVLDNYGKELEWKAWLKKQEKMVEEKIGYLESNNKEMEKKKKEAEKFMENIKKMLS